MELAAAEKIFEVLKDAGVRYLVVGGLAVNAHGYARMTMDIDMVVDLAPQNIGAALGALRAIGFRPAVPVTPEQFADPANRQRWRAEKGMQVLKLWSDAFPLTPVDVFSDEPFDFDVEYDAAYRAMLRDDLEVRIVRVSTLIAMKRTAGRPQDHADIAALERLLDEEA